MSKYFDKKEKLFYWIKSHPNLHYIVHMLRRFGDQRFYAELFEEGYPGIIKIDNNGNLNKDKEIFFVEIKANRVGLPCFIRYTLLALYEIKRLNFAPYVKFTDVAGWLQEKQPINSTTNIFEYYYDKLNSVDMLQIKESHHVYSCNCASLIMRANKNLGCFKENGLLAPYEIDEEYIEIMGRIYASYLKLNNITWNYIDKEIKSLIREDDRVLGIHIRGTDFGIAYKNHPRLITVEEFEGKIELLLRKGKYSKIFIATDDDSKLKYLKGKYADIVLTYDDTFRSSGDKNILSIQDSRPDGKYKKGLEVLRDVYTLASCKGLIAGLSHVSILARIIKSSCGELYEHKEIIINGFN